MPARTRGQGVSQVESNKELSPKQRDELLTTLKARFAKHMNRHKGIEWAKVESRLAANTGTLWSLKEMEATGGEPAVELVVVVERVRPGAYALGDTEIDTEASASALHPRRDSRPIENGLQVAVEGVGRGVDAVIDAVLAQLLERGESGQDAEQMP